MIKEDGVGAGDADGAEAVSVEVEGEGVYALAEGFGVVVGGFDFVGVEFAFVDVGDTVAIFIGRAGIGFVGVGTRTCPWGSVE